MLKLSKSCVVTFISWKKKIYAENFINTLVSNSFTSAILDWVLQGCHLLYSLVYWTKKAESIFLGSRVQKKLFGYLSCNNLYNFCFYFQDFINSAKLKRLSPVGF